VLRLATEDSVWSVPAASVDTLWVRGRSTRSGAVIGAVSGALLLGAAALGFVTACTEGPSEDPCEPRGVRAQVVLGGAALGALGGGGAGALVGALVPRWRQRHP
jgi:hypothetical protein